MRAVRKATWIVAVLAVVFALGACSKTLDIDEIEDQISTGIEEQTGAQVSEVDCPDEVDAEEGDTFDCTVTAEDGTEANVKVTQTSDDGDVTWVIE